MSLKHVKFLNNQLGGFKVIVMDELKDQYPDKFTTKNDNGEVTSQMDYKWFESEIRPNNFVYVRKDVNSISFTLQNGPIQEHGVNGCQVETLIHAAKAIIKTYNDAVPCRENSLAITKLEEAIHWLEARTKDRQSRGVEGTNQQ